MLHRCGFCQGTGEVCRSSISDSMVCQVCSGRGMVNVEEPVTICTSCKGTGRDPYKYPQALVTCLVCRGKGVVTGAKSGMPVSQAEEKSGRAKEEADLWPFVIKYPMGHSQ